MIELEKELKAKNIKPTAMRLLVLKFLKQQNGAVSLADIEAGFEQSDRVTIYRTVKTFESKGLLHSISISNNTHYALCAQDCTENKHQDKHLHFLCKKCKQTICLTQVFIPKMDIPEGFTLNDIEVIAKGSCDLCKNN